MGAGANGLNLQSYEMLLSLKQGPITFAGDNTGGQFIVDEGTVNSVSLQQQTFDITATCDIFYQNNGYGASGQINICTLNLYNAPVFTAAFFAAAQFSDNNFGGNTINGSPGGTSPRAILTNFAKLQENGTAIPGTDGINIGRMSAYHNNSGVTVYGAVGAPADFAHNYQAPVTGFSLTLGDGDGHVILDPAGTLATGTITMCPNPVNGQMVQVRSSQAVQDFTLLPNAGQSIVGAPITIPAGGGFNAIYKKSNTTWYVEPVAGILINDRSSKTANYSILSGEFGTQFDNVGASGAVVFTLPAAYVGAKFGFCCAVAQLLTVLAPASTSIAIGATNSAAAGNVASSTPFSYVEIEKITATQWVAKSSTGTWTVT